MLRSRALLADIVTAVLQTLAAAEQQPSSALASDRLKPEPPPKVRRPWLQYRDTRESGRQARLVWVLQ
jgi:hypothetical protein